MIFHSDCFVLGNASSFDRNLFECLPPSPIQFYKINVIKARREIISLLTSAVAL